MEIKYIPSKIYRELLWKRIEKKIKLFVLIGMAVWAMWMFQMVTAIAYVPVVVNILH